MTDIITDLEITFGLELEFFILYPEVRLLESVFPYTGKSPAGFALHQLIEEQGLSVIFLEEDSYHVDSEYTAWRVTRDNHELRDEEEDAVPAGYRVEAVELVSRKFRLGHDASQQELQAVMQVFGQMERAGCRLVTNIETGFHVHVGNGDLGFPLGTVKNIYSMATAFERCFDALHTTHRIQHGRNIEPMNPSNPPSFFFYNGTNEDRYLLTWLDDIERYKTLGTFLKHFDCARGEFVNFTNGKSSNINFDNLLEQRPFEILPPTTIEFRQHAGTLDVDEICAWILTVTNLVAWSHHVDYEYLDSFVEAKVFDTDFRMLQLLDILEVHPHAKAHFAQRLNLQDDAALRHAQVEIASASKGPFYTLVRGMEKARYTRSSARTMAAAIEGKLQDGLYGYLGPDVETLYPELTSGDDDSDDGVASQTSEELDRELLELCELSLGESPENSFEDMTMQED